MRGHVHNMSNLWGSLKKKKKLDEVGDRFENLLKMTPPPPPLTGNKRPVPDRKQSYIFFCSQIVTE